LTASGRGGTQSGGSCEAAALPAGVRLAPSSCRGLRRLPGEGLHLRMRLRHLGVTLSENLKPQKNYVFYCQSCGDIIVKDRKFLRVLPLPSENWTALVDEWCCHPNPFARSTLNPQHDDCFLGDTFFLLNSGNESHKSEENTRVICKCCKTVSQFIQGMVAQCLVELSSAKSTFRFTVKGDNGKIYILIWLLNSDTLLVESLGNSSSHSVFTLFGDVFMPSSGPVGTWNAVKVLYQPCIKSKNKDLADAWENDIGVHPLKFPSETCLELLLILGLSTTSLPPSLRFMNSFQKTFCRHIKLCFVFIMCLKTYK
uniref:E3 ubiquitin-protein ligase E3D n=1 Tax=Athene cunicularia TaxID=194338 RepID=A0A663NFB9_ATHCN